MDFTKQMDILMRFNLQSRQYYSPRHIKSAAFFTRQCYQLEEGHKQKENISDQIIDDHRSYVTGAIFASVSFLEATINELFADTAEHPDSEIIAQLDSSAKSSM